jgi:hypothetical protein
MKRLSLRMLVPLFAVALTAFAMVPTATLAHEARTVGDYEIEVGFVTEPAIQDEVNGIWISVMKGEEPVTGLADTLKAEVVYGDQTRAATLTPVFGEDGSYTSVFIPTEPGDYTFHFTGKIGDVDVDETFTSSPEGFDSVAARADYAFPTAANGSTGSTLAYPAAIGAVVIAAGAASVVVRRARR